MYFATSSLLPAGGRVASGPRRRPVPTKAPLFAICVVIAGIAIEVLQEIAIPDRHAELGDMLAEVIGAFSALAIHAWMRRVWSLARR